MTLPIIYLAGIFLAFSLFIAYLLWVVYEIRIFRSALYFVAYYIIVSVFCLLGAAYVLSSNVVVSNPILMIGSMPIDIIVWVFVINFASITLYALCVYVMGGLGAVDKCKRVGCNEWGKERVLGGLRVVLCDKHNDEYKPILDLKA